MGNSDKSNFGVTQLRARDIMGKNFLGIEESVKYFNAKPSQKQILEHVPFSEKFLLEHKDSHVLVAICQVSILDIWITQPQLFSGLWEISWYKNEAFTKRRGRKIRWQLIRKTPIPNSERKSLAEHQALLAKNEIIPEARVMVYIILGHYLATGEILFPTEIGCSDTDSRGLRLWLYFGEAYSSAYLSLCSGCLKDWGIINPDNPTETDEIFLEVASAVVFE